MSKYYCIVGNNNNPDDDKSSVDFIFTSSDFSHSADKGNQRYCLPLIFSSLKSASHYFNRMSENHKYVAIREFNMCDSKLGGIVKREVVGESSGCNCVDCSPSVFWLKKRYND